MRGGSWGSDGIRWGVVAHTNGAVRYRMGETYAGPDNVTYASWMTAYLFFAYFFAVELF